MCLVVPPVMFYEAVHASPLGCTVGVLGAIFVLAFVIDPVLERVFRVTFSANRHSHGLRRHGPGWVSQVVGFAALVGLVDYVAGDALPCWLAATITAVTTLGFLVWMSNRALNVPSRG